MTNQIQNKPQGQAIMAEFSSRFGLDTAEMRETLVNTVFKGRTKPTKAQVYAFLIVANELKFNPWSKQIYAFPDKGGGIIPMVGADGWYKILADHPQSNGCPTEHITDDSGKIIGCKATLYRKDWEHPVTATEWVSECSTGSPPWKKSPGRMIRHRAIAQVVRVGLGIGAVYTPDEAQEIYDAQFEVTSTASNGATSINEAIMARADETQEGSTQEAEHAEESEPARVVDEFGEEVIFEDGDHAQA